MATKIRLQRHGKKGQPFYHIVVADSRFKRDGRLIEKLGTYNPNKKLLVLIVGIRSVNMFYKTVNEKERILIASTLLGLVTYFIHAFFNNFLDIDKVSIAVWSFIAIIVSIDLYKKNDLTKN